MYMQNPSQSVLLPKLSNWQQRRPNLSLTKSPLWSYSAGLGAQSYPSPPMSNSPTSPRRSAQLPSTSGYNSSGSGGISAPATTGAPRTQLIPPPPSELSPLYPEPVPTPFAQQRQDLQPRPQAIENIPYPEPYAVLGGSGPSMAPMLGEHFRTQLPPVTYAGPVSAPPPSVPRMPRTSRRAKAHVAKACQNCKKAHLSCDEARPCARCVASGKQATCIDVEHKKRGRPRLRDESGARTDQPSMTVAPGVAPAATPVGRGHHRADSYQRQLRSRTRGESQGTLQLQEPLTAFSSQAPAVQRPGEVSVGYFASRSDLGSASGEMMAFLNLDLQILKCNEAFRQMFGAGGDPRGRRLSDFIDIRHESQVQRLQNELREERSRRDPTYLPSIFPDRQEQQAVQALHDTDVDRITQGFDERRESWTYVLSDGRPEQLYSRVSLARTTIYFAVIILRRIAQPSPAQRSAFGPTSIELPAPLPVAPSAISPRGFGFHPPGPASPYGGPSAPASPFASFQTLGMTLPPNTGSMTSLYAPPSRSDPSYFPRLAPYGAPTTELPLTSQPPTSRPRSTTMEALTSPRAGRRQRPQSLYFHPRGPAGSAPTTPLGAAFSQSVTEHGELSSSRTPGGPEEEEDTSEESARKRRRTGMNIKDVLGR